VHSDQDDRDGGTPRLSVTPGHPSPDTLTSTAAFKRVQMYKHRNKHTNIQEPLEVEASSATPPTRRRGWSRARESSLCATTQTHACTPQQCGRGPRARHSEQQAGRRRSEHEGPVVMGTKEKQRLRQGG